MEAVSLFPAPSPSLLLNKTHSTKSFFEANGLSSHESSLGLYGVKGVQQACKTFSKTEDRHGFCNSDGGQIFLRKSAKQSVRGRRPAVDICHKGVTFVTKAMATTMEPPYTVVITGSSKGLGLALAREFLQSGDSVVICSRSEERVAEAVKSLQEEFGEKRVVGTPCNVSKGEDVARLASFASSQFGHIDIWINNAGSNAYSYGPLIDSRDDHLQEIVETNTLGVMLCCRQALLTMRGQSRGGHIFNMDGAGADGNATPRFAAYGATKRSLSQFTKSLQAELKMLAVSNVVVHNLSPGMVTTELLMSGANTRQAKFFINALAEPAEEVSRYLVPRVRNVLTESRKTSSYIRYLTGPKAYTQILARLLFKSRKDRYVLEE